MIQKIPTILLVDQREIPGSFDCVSLFVNGKHIYDFDDTVVGIEHDDLVGNLETALDEKAETVCINTSQLARCIALEGDEEFDEKDVDSHEQLTHGYNNEDLIAAVLRMNKWQL